MYCKETGFENLDLFELAQVNAVWQAAGKTIQELRGFLLKKDGEYLEELSYCWLIKEDYVTPSYLKTIQPRNMENSTSTYKIDDEKKQLELGDVRKCGQDDRQGQNLQRPCYYRTLSSRKLFQRAVLMAVVLFC